MYLFFQTGQPYVNSDGSVYRYDPANPPKVAMDEEAENSSGNGGPVVTPAGTSSHHQSAGSSEQAQPPPSQSSAQPQKCESSFLAHSIISKEMKLYNFNRKK